MRAVDKIWENYYHVKLPYLQTRNVDEMRRYGIRMPGIPAWDREVENSWVVTQMNINMMFERFKEGVTIRVVNYNDTTEIYEIIYEHLTTWLRFLSTSVNTTYHEVIVDLIELDHFASVVYDKAKSIFTDMEREAIYRGNFAGVQAINYFNVLKRSYRSIQGIKRGASGEEIIELTPAATDTKVVERTGLDKYFIEHINQVNNWR